MEKWILIYGFVGHTAGMCGSVEFGTEETAGAALAQIEEACKNRNESLCGICVQK